MSKIEDVIKACHFIVYLLSYLTRAVIRMDLPQELCAQTILGPAMDEECGGREVVCEVKLRHGRVLRLRYFGHYSENDPDAVCEKELALFLLSELAPRVDSEAIKRSSLGCLSMAESRILALVKLPNSEIASRLGIEKETLRSHLKRIYRKLGIHRRHDLLVFAE